MKRIVGILMAMAAFLTFCMGASAQTSSGNLSSSDALKLAQSARDHYWSAMNGHNTKITNATCPEGSFLYKDTDYRYFCSDLGTKEKFLKYMNESFTLNAINKGINKHRFIEYKGKWAQPNADGGSLLEWNKAKAKLIYQRKDIRQFQFTVPYGEKVQYEKKKVTFVKVRGKWQINDIDDVR